ncbi:MAG: galactose-1-phosphate uridylyltransferase [Candidatus Aminicenantia bacterium]
MSELRFDPLRRRWTIIAPKRKRRPQEYYICQMDHLPEKERSCPFCYGNEGETPPESFVIAPPGRKPNTLGWSVRVVPNKFPALKGKGQIEKRKIGHFDLIKKAGAHEVIIESPRHNYPISERKIEEIRDVLIAFRERIKHYSQDNRVRYVLIFKNYGIDAGASLIHPHSQLIATPIVPSVVDIELRSSQEHYFQNKRCLMCQIMTEELALQERIVIEDKDYLIWEPFASSFPFETWILPQKHGHDFSLLDDFELEKTAVILKEALRRIKIYLKNPPYNLILHTSPIPKQSSEKEDYWETVEYAYHWHFELIPRLIRIAGFEWGSGMQINPIPPEEAAIYLREIKL